MSSSFVLPLARAAGAFLLPSRCLACARGEVREFFRGGVCRECWESLPTMEGPRCAVCDTALPSTEAPTCGRCLLDPPAFRRLRAAAPYRGAARDVLLAFKFRGADFLAKRLAGLMVERLGPPPLSGDARGNLVAAVPATGRARRSRGYHPAEALAAAVADALGLAFRGRLLRKVRETEVQSRVPAHRRAQNVRRAFCAAALEEERILLVDDVATSGATARECARRLIDAGAGEVTVWCFARASRGEPDGRPQGAISP